jgi:hypothetical protein
MKHFYLTVVCLLLAISVQGQAYEGKDDMKFQIGANVQKEGTGIYSTFDLGIGENMSIGLAGAYLLGVEELYNAGFGDRFDLKGRFNANLGSVLELGDEIDIYPGLNLGLKNFGFHVGARYFFSDGFGLFLEATTPLAKYNTDELTPAEEYFNQFNVSFGASFNIQ